MSIKQIELLLDGESINLLPNSLDILPVSESARVAFKVISTEPANLNLNIGDYSITLRPHKFANEHYEYITESSKSFRNFVGLAQLTVSGEQESVESRLLNIFASKSTYDRAVSFLRYIISEEDISTACFSLTKGQSSPKAGRDNIFDKLVQGIKCLDFFIDEWARFHHDPCTKAKVSEEVRTFNSSMPLDDRAIEYLSSHQDTLSPSVSENANIRLRGKDYSITHMKAPVIKQQKNVYENQVILYFTEHFLSFLFTLKRELKQRQYSDKDQFSVDGIDYISIDRILKDSGIFVSFHLDKVESAIRKCRTCIQRLNVDFDCRIDASTPLMPTPTQKVMQKQHYLNLYKKLHSYYEVGEPNWRGNSELYGLRNMPKIYEFVVLINLIKGLNQLGYTLIDQYYLDSSNDTKANRPLNEPNNTFIFRGENEELIKLEYDISMLRLADLSKGTQPGTLVDIVHTQRPFTWRPDFKITHLTKSDVYTHILDAKYSSRREITDFHIHSCSEKYLTNARVLKSAAGKRFLDMPESLTLVYSSESRNYVSRYREQALAKDVANELLPIKPALGAAGILEYGIEETSNLLNKLLHRNNDTLSLRAVD